MSKVLSGIMLPVVILTGIYIWSQNIFFKNNFFIIYCFLLTLTTVFLFFICKNLVGLKLTLSEFTVKKCSGWIKTNNIWLMIVSISNLILSNTDILMLGMLSNSNEVGGYVLSASFVTIITIGIAAANLIYGPEISSYYKNKDLFKARIIFRKTQSLIVCLSLPIVLILIIFSKWWLSLSVNCYNANLFSGTLIILSMGAFTNAATGPVAVSLFMFGKTRLFSISVLIAAVMNIIGNFYLINALGALGAAISTTFCVAGTNIIQYIIARSYKII